MKIIYQTIKKNIFSKLILTGTLLTATTPLFSQAPAIAWQKALGGTSNDVAYSVEKTSDGGFIVAGSTESKDGDLPSDDAKKGVDMWVIKLKSDGALDWKTVLGGTGNEEARSVQQTIDGGYIVAGYTTSNDGDIKGTNNSTDGSADFWVVKLESTGAFGWQRCLGGSAEDRAKSIRQNTDGSYIVAGSTASNDGNVSGNHTSDGFTTDYWVVKIDNGGNLLWQKTFGGTADDEANCVIPTSDNGYFVVGNASSTDGDAVGNHGGTDALVLRLDKDGVALAGWKKLYGGSGNDRANFVRPLSDGSYIVAGDAASTNGDLLGAGYEGGSGGDCWIFKLTSTGTIGNLNKLYGGTSNETAYGIEATTKGYIVAAYTNSSNGDVVGSTTGGAMWALKLLADGAIEWQKPMGGSSQEQGYSVQAAADGGYLIVGESNSSTVTGAVNRVKDAWLVKLASDGDSPALPLTLLSFKAAKQNNKVQLTWLTANEQNTSYFVVERSNDGQLFTALKQVSAIGNSTSEYTYTTTDEIPLSGKSYYRLKSADKDGKFTRTGIVEVIFNKDGTITINPNPVKSLLRILWQSALGSNATVQVTDVSGKLLIGKKVSLIQGENNISLSVQTLPSGTYMARMVAGSEVKVIKFVKD